MNNDIIATTIRQQLEELGSSKIKEKKKGIDGLKEYLGYDDQAVSFLNESSAVKSSSIRWDSIFSHVTECLLKACDGGAKAKKTSRDVIVGAQGLIWTVISKANTRSSIYVPTAKLLGFVFEVWEIPQAKEELESFCCNLIISELLEKEMYWSKMGGDKWNAIVQLAFDLHTGNSQDKKKTETCVTILLLVLKHGTSYSNIALILKKKIFTFIVNLLQNTRDLADNDFFQNNLVSQLIFLSTELGPECKAALCKAGELLLPRLIRVIYDQQKAGPTLTIVSQLYKALLVQYNAHHPLGIDSKESSFSGDAHKWKDILKRVYYMIDREIARLQRSKVTECSEDFVHLTVHLVAWFYHDTEDSALGDMTLDTSVTAKRVKLTVFNIEYFTELLRESANPYDIWPVLHIVACLVYRFPELITPEEYKTLLQMFSEYQCNNFTNNETIMNYLNEGFFSFFLALNHITFPDDEIRVSVQKIWKNIFLKLIGSNQCIRSSHLLLRYLLNYRPEICQTEQLMKSYTDKVVSLNEESLKTLFYLISKVQTSTETSLELVDWLLHGMESLVLSDRESADHVCPATLFMLCSNTKPDTLECHSSELDHFFGFLQPSSLEYFYAASNFDRGLFTGETNDFASKGARDMYDFVDGKQIIFNTPVLNKMNECFTKLVNTMSNKLSTEVLDRYSVEFILNNLSFWICFGKYIEHLPTQSKLKINLLTCMPDILDKVLSKLSHLNLISTELYFSFFNVLHSINQAHIGLATVLLPGESENFITTYISAISVNQLPSGNILETVMPVNTYPKEIRDLNFQKLSLTFSDKQLKIFRYVVLLTQYSSNNTRLVYNQKLVISKLFETIDQYLIYGFKNMHLLTSAYVINNVARIKDIDLKSMESCIVTFLELCKTWQRQSDVIEHVLLPLLKLFFHKVKERFEVFRNELVDYLTKFYILMNKGYFGASLQTKIVECFGLLFEIDPQIEWALSSEKCLQLKCELKTETQPLIIEMLAFVQSPFHSVRISAIKYLTVIFQTSTLKRLKDWVDEDAMFTLLTQSLEKILELDDDFTESEYLDEAVNRTASFLHSIACIISNCPCFSRQALNYSFHMFVKKKLNLSLFKKVFSLILKHMNISIKQLLNENMFYILTSWYTTYKTFQSFPFPVFYSDSKIFFKANAINIVTILYLNKNVEEMNHYAELVSMEVPSLLKGAMPKILALCEEGIISNEKLLSSNILQTRMEEIVLNLISNISDYKHLNINACVPAPCITHINFVQLKDQLDMLSHKLGLNMSPIVYMCENNPSSIQRLHLNLARYIYEARSFEFKIEAAHRYAIFLQLLKPVFSESENLILDFIVHSVIYTLLHTLSSLECSSIILTCLDQFLHDILPQCSPILIPLLPGLIKSLLPMTQLECDLKRKSLCIIDFLVVQHCNQLRDGILELDPFPNSEEYKHISQVYNNFRGYQPKTCLHKEISHFITAGISNPKCKITERCRLEGLNNINYLLTNQRDYLNRFNVSSLSDCEQETLEKMLNRLVVVLSELARSPDEKISINAVVCLGKIGPYCMNPTTALTTVPVKKDSADIMLTQVIASNLIIYLGDHNIKVVSIASEALLYLLDSPEGYTIINKLTLLERKLIYPMLPSTKNSTVTLQNLFNESKFKALVDVTNHWVPLKNVSHEQWISNLTATIINSFETSKCYLRYLIELCNIKTDFAEKILCYLVYFILRIKSRSKEAEKVLSNRMRFFFSTHQMAVHSSDSTRSETEIHLNKKSVKCLLDVVHFVRMNQDRPDGFLLHLNYLHVAQAAMFCSAPYSAILFSHFSSEQLLSELGDRYSMDESLSPIDYICNHRPSEGSHLQDILRDAYTEINDLDSVHGVGNSKLTHMASRISHYKITSNWQRVLECSDSLMSAQGTEQTTAKQDMKQSLAQCGLYFIQNQLSEGQDFDACWRLSQWDCPDNGCNENSFAINHYKALKCLHKGETILCVENIYAARKSLVDLLNLTDMEYTKQVQPVLSKLRMLQEIEEFVESQYGRESDILAKWEDNQFIGNVEYKLVEPILSQRSVLLKESNLDHVHTVPYHLKIARKTRIEGHFNVAERILYSLDQMNMSKTEKFRVHFEQAQLFWDRNEREVAKFSLRNILPNMRDEPNCDLIYFKALRTYGCWQAMTNSENLRFIMQKYFEPALKALPKDEVEEKLKTYDCLARYADEKQVQISESLSNIQRFINPSSKTHLEKQQQALDTRETATRQEDRKLYLLMAIEYYMKSLTEGNLNDIKIFRLVSLWLDNTHEADLLHLLKESIMRIPSYKFVKVLPQLVGRISKLPTEQNLLMLQVIEKCALEHPHHTLPLILAVANSLKDEIYMEKVPINNETMDSRIKGAEILLTKLKKSDKKNLLDIIREQEILSSAYIKLANYLVGKAARMSVNVHTIPSSQQLVKIKDFNQICVSTMNLKINQEGEYKNIVGIHKFDRSFSIPGGINEPKRITCIGSDGHRYIQLLKGKDDPRQDAVMQQVFTIMNELLNANKTASKRNLSVQTYKVVPLSQTSGVIEWCNDSLPIYAYLVGDSRTPGAHSKYNPKDLSHSKCREKLEALRLISALTSKKLSEYLSICKRFNPVFRYFFLERCKLPSDWHSMVTNYTRSVATSSMVGYILGLGDRHLNNILISLKTGQVIHIDFGIAFEQGHILPTPETVPFRLSRDIEDGMGVTGTEGTFKRSCETTLSVLRDSSETILSILEVLLYDPLYTWTLTPTKAAEKQKGSSSVFTATDIPVNKIAARALFRLKQKLLGIEDGLVLSVEAQVNTLILKAKDPENLCALFPGWQPYL